MKMSSEAFRRSERIRRSTQLQQMDAHPAGHCKKCELPDNEEMVQCDACDSWYHYNCVGVTDDIRDCDWLCFKCVHHDAGQEGGHAIPDVNPESKISQMLDSKSIKSRCGSLTSNSSARVKLMLLEEERKLQERREQERAAEQERKERSDREYLEKKLALLENMSKSSVGGSDKSHSATSRRRVNNWIQQSRSHIDQSKENCKADLEYKIVKPKETLFASTSPVESLPQIEQTLKDMRIAAPVNPLSNPYIPNIFSNIHQNYEGREINCHTTHKSDDIFRPNPVLEPFHLAARHAIPKELPTFNGYPSEWPLFISSFRNTTETCGLSNNENLVRLQRAVKGDALEAVRSLLLTPSTVPEVISTLEMLYGRPELIIHTMLQKIRSEPSPRPDNLVTLVTFAVSVKNLCAMMTATNLDAYLNNPTLLQELVDKLPTQIKLNWGLHLLNISKPSLDTFSAWLFNVARAANSVTIPAINSTVEKKKNTHAVEKGSRYFNVHTEDCSEGTSAEANKLCMFCRSDCKSIQTKSAVDCSKFIKLNVRQRWDIVVKHKLCRRCLVRHKELHCKLKTVCGRNGCSYGHHQLLHKDGVNLETPTSSVVAEKTSPDSNISTEFTRNPENITLLDTSVVNTPHYCHARKSGQSMLFRIIPVILSGPDIKIETFAFLDDGSSITLIEEAFASELGLTGIPEPLCLKWTAETHRNEMDSKRVSLKITGVDTNAKCYSISNAHTVKTLDLPIQSIYADQLAQHYPHLRGIPITTYQDAIPRILIGIDNWKLGITLKAKEGTSVQPAATKTRLGWTVYGQCIQNDSHATRNGVYHHFQVCDGQKNEDEKLHRQVKEYFSAESFGVTKPKIDLESSEVTRARKILEETTHRIGRKFEIGLLWKYDVIELPNSYSMAERRLYHLKKKMAKDPVLAANLNQQMQDFVRKGYARKLSPEEDAERDPRTWYLPIFPVRNPNKPQKTRLVLDAGAEVDGVSLNSMLSKGPDLLTSLPAVLHRFRERKIAICGDIREMFQQVLIKQEDQRAQRFLWPSDDDIQIAEPYVMQVMTFGATCSPSMALYVKNRNAMDYNDKFPRAATAIIENHYVDDLLDSVDTELDAIQLARDVAYIHEQAGFEIRGWISNSPLVSQELKSESSDNKNLSITADIDLEKVLGMWWQPAKDTFTYSLVYNKANKEIILGNRRPTKREVLRTLSSIFDPLGLLANFLIYVKILLQEIWRSSIEWDDEITDDQFKKWLIWVRLLPQVETIEIPRCYLGQKTAQLHVFMDASDILTYIPLEDANESALTPNHFLLGSSDGRKPLGDFTDDKEVLRKNWMKSKQYAQAFWKRWVIEYLPTLTRRTKWHEFIKPVEKGDIVIVIDENNNRMDWPRGIILDVLPGKDGQVRKAVLKTSEGVFTRPVVKLAVLDVRKGNSGTPTKELVIPGVGVSNPEK